MIVCATGLSVSAVFAQSESKILQTQIGVKMLEA